MTEMDAQTVRRFDDAVARMLSRAEITERAATRGFPHFADQNTGEWTLSPDGHWTGGFWGGLLALAAATTGEARHAELAGDVARRLTVRASSKTAFRGFLFFYGAGVAHLIGQSAPARESALAGARGLAASFNHDAGVIPLGDEAEEADAVGEGAANIDAVPGTVPLLAWAAGELDQPELAEIARRHAERHIEYCVRADGSVCQSAAFDQSTGALVRRYTHKGLADDSTWARAQAWAMLGFAQATHWVSRDFLDTALTVADWWLEHLPADHVAPWDFDAGAPRDTSATAIAAAALLKLSVLAPDRTHYRERALAMVDALVTRFLTPVGEDDTRPAGILTSGCFDHRRGLAIDNELVWGDYFLVECLLVLRGVIRATAL
ncbi:glycoside hydrolase family 88 protein [Saccharopolyspora hordei]|uniref:Unsaturated chondroitin disaccharide hydrolase n=1 Tax=Saccharopolyspora hordei TaxID=1838 RepID=A0A853ALX6_9PSEU|nr:glycoside hydrolase family 88 protein [Saccharopolyspora hordei]NYI84049.1 unsaturated chondroitin disaccharide hydrolase [Saccharopolyspora hordei]